MHAYAYSHEYKLTFIAMVGLEHLRVGSLRGAI